MLDKIPTFIHMALTPVRGIFIVGRSIICLPPGTRTTEVICDRMMLVRVYNSDTVVFIETCLINFLICRYFKAYV